MHQAAQGAGQAQSRVKTIPAPVGGWNARDSIANMDPRDAPIMDNFFPDTTVVRLRRGSSVFCSSLGSGAVETLIPYANGATSKFLAGANSQIYEISSGSGSSLGSGFSNNRWQSVPNFNGYSILVNGADTPRAYSGSALSTLAISGAALTSANLIHVNDWKARLFFTEKDTMKAWYLPVSQIQGSAAALDFSTVFKMGGYLVGMTTWTRDGGSGPDDLAVFLSSKGEVAVYEGTDPSSSTTWALVGVFRMGAPIGRRCFIKVGTDVVLLTLDGFTQLSRALPVARTQQEVALSDKISGAVQTATSNYRSNFGWEAIQYPNGRMGVFNIPTAENSTSVQYVINTNTGAWCRFTGWNANCFALYEEQLYFGANDGSVYLADTGTSDSSSNITGDVQQAFSRFGLDYNKQFLAVRPAIASDGVVSPAIAINVDYQNVAATGDPLQTTPNGALWDTVLWDTTAWGADELVAADWLGVDGIGIDIALRMRIAVNAVTFSWASTSYLFRPGPQI